MSGYAELSPAEAQELMQAEDACVIDIRDGNSFSSAHITGAIQLDQTSLGPFLEATEKDAALVIYCYHGISSHSAASFFVDQGFSRVSHLAGGFAAWQQQVLQAFSEVTRPVADGVEGPYVFALLKVVHDFQSVEDGHQDS